ncbi:MAG: pantoate--beta-alanine ligase, partial [Planctomycetes bacterium]|nr:pantoate--beta-alanine ligase [Planctomycetota bacterium]
DLNLPVEIVVCPTVREKDGLAVSSRNQYLSRQHKKDAALIYKSLQKCRQMILAGETDVSVIIDCISKVLNQSLAIEIEYISVVDAQTLQNLTKISGKILAAIAVKIGSTRLIDNILVDTSE